MTNQEERSKNFLQVFLGAGTCLLAFSAIPDTMDGGGRVEQGCLEEGRGGGGSCGGGGVRKGTSGGGGVGRRGILVTVLCFGQAFAIATSLIFLSHQAGVAG